MKLFRCPTSITVDASELYIRICELELSNLRLQRELLDAKDLLSETETTLFKANLRLSRAMSNLREMDRLAQAMESLATWPDLRPIFRRMLSTCKESADV